MGAFNLSYHGVRFLQDNDNDDSDHDGAIETNEDHGNQINDCNDYSMMMMVVMVILLPWVFPAAHELG